MRLYLNIPRKMQVISNKWRFQKKKLVQSVLGIVQLIALALRTNFVAAMWATPTCPVHVSPFAMGNLSSTVVVHDQANGNAMMATSNRLQTKDRASPVSHIVARAVPYTQSVSHQMFVTVCRDTKKVNCKVRQPVQKWKSAARVHKMTKFNGDRERELP